MDNQTNLNAPEVVIDPANPVPTEPPFAPPPAPLSETGPCPAPDRHHPFSSRSPWPSEPGMWPEPVPGTELLETLTRLFTRFVVLPKWAPETLALWTLHTYAFELRDITTYLGIESPPVDSRIKDTEGV